MLTRRHHPSSRLLGTLLVVSSIIPLEVFASTSMQVTINGVPLSIRTYEKRGTPHELASEATQRWSANGPAPLIWQAEEGRIVIGRQRGAFHETLTLIPAKRPGHTEMHHALRDLRQPVEPLGQLPFALPIGWKLISVVRHGSSATAAQTFLLRGGRGRDFVVAQSVRALRAAGWTSPRILRDSNVVLWSARGSQSLEAVIEPRGQQTRIVVQVGGHAH